MASPVLDHLLATGRYDEAIAVADMLIAAWPANSYAMVKKGTSSSVATLPDCVRMAIFE